MDDWFENNKNPNYPGNNSEQNPVSHYPDFVYPEENYTDNSDGFSEGNYKEVIPETDQEHLSYPVKDEEKKKKHHPVRNLIFGILVIILLLNLALFGYFFIISGNAKYKPFDPIQEDAAWALEKKFEKGVTNILLIGTDARISGEDSRSDSMIIVSVCPLQRKIYLTSVLRDSYVTIPGYGQNRINHAYQMGGAKLLIETIEMNFHIRIDQYAKVDFYSFMDVIDAVGGVEMKITDDEVQYVNSYLSEINHLLNIDPYDGMLEKGGEYLLNGKQALAYSRIRYIGTDFGRTERQRKVISALLNKVKRNPVSVLKALPQIFKAVETDISRVRFGLYGMMSPWLLITELESDRIPMEGMWWNDLMPNGQEVLGIDFERQTKALKEKIYGK